MRKNITQIKKGTKALVCGMAKSGLAAARFLRGLGADVTVQDLNPDAFLPEETIKTYLGKNPDDIVQDFDLIVLSPGIPIDLPFIKKAYELNKTVIGEVELAYLYTPCPVIGITGTNGKTTVTTLLGEIMRRHNPKTIVAGNIGTPFTEQVPLLTENSLVVAEISSFQLESVQTFSPWISAVLNLTPDHLDRHKNMETYRAMKERIFANQQPDNYCVLGWDNPITKNMRPPCNTVYFSAKEILKEGVFLENGAIKARLFGEETPVASVKDMRILLENALAATALALCAGVGPRLIAEVLANFKGVPHRIEYVTTVNGIEFYNDSKATNPHSAIKGLEAMTRPTVLICGGYDKDAGFGDWVKCFEGKVRHLIVLGETADKIIETCRAHGFSDYVKVNSLRDAVQLAFSKAEEKDAVLLSPACASWDMFDNFEQRGDLFKQFVLEL